MISSPTFKKMDDISNSFKKKQTKIKEHGANVEKRFENQEMSLSSGNKDKQNEQIVALKKIQRKKTKYNKNG